MMRRQSCGSRGDATQVAGYNADDQNLLNLFAYDGEGNPLGVALGALGGGLGHTLSDWASTGDPRAFGQSFGGTLALAGAGVAPFATGAEAAAAAEVAEAEGAGGAGLLGNWFAAGTLIQMTDGSTKPIEQIKVGDEVQSRPQSEATYSVAGISDTKAYSTTKQRVVRTFVHGNAVSLKLHLESGETITTTPGHPFVVDGKGYVPAGQLAIGNAIVTRAGPPVKIVGIDHPATRATVYNVEVEGTHTYFIGQANGGVWVHNASLLTVQDAYDAASAGARPFKGGALSDAGRALAKHNSASRPGSVFPVPSGPPAAINGLAQDVIGEIVSNPASVKIFRGPVFDIVEPGGRGLRFYTADGSLKGFLEP